MKKAKLFLFLFSCIIIGLQAQDFGKARAYSILKYDKNSTSGSYEKFLIKSLFASSNIKRKQLPKDLKVGQIVAIDYYYTDFKSDTNFSQVKLDTLRFQNLKKYYPSIFNRIDSVPLRFIEQTLAKTKKEAIFYYHGFVVHYEKDLNLPNARKKEIIFINNLFKHNFKVDDSPVYGSTRKISGVRPNDILNVWGKEIQLGYPDTIIRANNKSMGGDVAKCGGENVFVSCFTQGRPVSRDSSELKIYRIPKQYYPGSTPPPFSDGIYGMMRRSHGESKLRYLTLQPKPLPNEVSGNLLKKLNQYSADSIVIVIDITGSMTGAMAMVLKWMHQSAIEPKIKGVVLFNDGNKKKNHEKIIGSTGGIYYVDDLKDLHKTLIEGISNGGGGDRPENDLEALLKAKERYKTGSYVLVADNISEPRDMSLLSKINFKVDILVCNGLETNEAYVRLKNSTHGVLINKR